MLCAVEKRRSPGRCERSGVRKRLATLNRVFRKDLTEMLREEKRHEGTIRGSHVDILQRRSSRYTGPKVGVYSLFNDQQGGHFGWTRVMGSKEERRGASSFSWGLRDHLKTNASTLSEMVSQ